MPNSKKPYHAYTHAPAQSWRGLWVCLVVASTGFFHGYDNAVVNGVFEMPAFRAHMGWPPSSAANAQSAKVAWQEGLTVNGFNGGAALSALLFGSFLVDRHGRLPALRLGSLLFGMGGAIQAASPNAGTLIAGRFVAGVGVGLTSSAGTSYIAEVAPPSSRGAMIGIYQNNICIAILFASANNYAIQAWEHGWQLALGLQLATGLLVLVGLAALPETPRFLVKAGRLDEARQVLRSLRVGDVQEECDLIVDELRRESAAGEATWREALVDNASFRNVVLVGCGVQLGQIITGINAIVSFSGTMFRGMGVTGLSAAILPFVAFLAGNMIGSFALVDRVGRRPILVLGMAGMAASLLTAGLSRGGGVAVACVIGYMFAFGASWGYGAWLYIPEIMPLRVRGRAVGLCTFINWGPANGLSAFLTPWMLRPAVLGSAGTLLFFGCVAAVFAPLALLFLPETKGLPLEQILPMFACSRKDGGLCRFVAGNLRHGSGAREPADSALL